MPKQTANITRTKRISILKDVLARWGRLDKNKIDSHVAEVIGCDVKDIAKALYRDLADLVLEGELDEFRYSPDGAFLEEYNSEIHKNTKGEWSLKGHANQIIGASVLQKFGGLVHASDRLKHGVQVDSANKKLDVNYITLFFEFSGVYYTLKILKDYLPVNIVIGRVSKNGKYDFKSIEKKYGKRLIALSIPNGNITSFKNENQTGHVLLAFQDPDTVTITDLGSKNGTVVSKLIEQEAMRMIEEGSSVDEQTYTHSWTALESDTVKSKEIKNNCMNIGLPIMVKLGEKFKVLIA